MHRVNRMSQFSIWPRNFATAVHHFSFCQSFASLQNEHPHPKKKSNNKQHCVRRRTTLPVQVAPFKLKKNDVWCGQKKLLYTAKSLLSSRFLSLLLQYVACCYMLFILQQYVAAICKGIFQLSSSTIKLFSSIYRKDIRYRHTICTWTHWWILALHSCNQPLLCCCATKWEHNT